MSQPTKKQLDYLYGLGYRGIKPLTKGEASAALDVMTTSGDQADAEQAIIAHREWTTPSQLPSKLKGCLGSLILLGGCIAWMSSGDKAQPEPAPPVIRPPAFVPNPAPKPVSVQPPSDAKPIQLPPPVAKPTEPTSAAQPQQTQEPAAPDAVTEKHANGSLTLAKQYIKINRPTKAVETLEHLIRDYPGTAAAQEAEKLLKSATGPRK